MHRAWGAECSSDQVRESVPFINAFKALFPSRLRSVWVAQDLYMIVSDGFGGLQIGIRQCFMVTEYSQ